MLRRWALLALMFAAIVFCTGFSCSGSGSNGDDDDDALPDDDDDDVDVDDDVNDDDATSDDDDSVSSGDDDASGDDDEVDDDVNDDDAVDDDLADDDDTDDDDAADDDDTADDDDAADDDDDLPPFGYQVGERMPDFTLVDQEGADWTLSDQSGSVVLLDCSATWCPPCKTETPKLQELSETYAAQPVVIAQLITENNRGLPPTDANIDDWVETYGLTIPVLKDPQWGVCGPVGNGYIPFYWIMDADGVIRSSGNYLSTFTYWIDLLLAE
ncbi:peroxiredoxin family protein [bacterium]|nr:peroxiredoxin family protein [bacterium]